MSGPQWVHKPLYDPIGVTREWLKEQSAIMNMQPDELLRRLNMDWPTVVVGSAYFTASDPAHNRHNPLCMD